MKNRIGQIKIDSSLLDSMLGTKDISLLFSEFIPFRITNENQWIVYCGYCKHFEEISGTDEIPEYEAILTHEKEEFSDLGYNVTIRFNPIICI